MHHSFLIHSSANGHLGGFHVLAIVNSAVMNIGLHMSLSILRTQISYVSPALADGFFTLAPPGKPPQSNDYSVQNLHKTSFWFLDNSAPKPDTWDTQPLGHSGLLSISYLQAFAYPSLLPMMPPSPLCLSKL